jgi:hypothetical protein
MERRYSVITFVLPVPAPPTNMAGRWFFTCNVMVMRRVDVRDHREICVQRVQTRRKIVTRSFAHPKEQHKREHK